MSSKNFPNQSSLSNVTKTTQAVVVNESQSPPLLLFASGGMVLALIGVIVYSKILWQQSEKKLNFERFRTQELDKKLKLALENIRKLENNPDLADSRHFNLDYLRLRMSEDVFRILKKLESGVIINCLRVVIQSDILSITCQNTIFNFNNAISNI